MLYPRGSEGAHRLPGIAVPGVELKLVPVDEKIEARLRGHRSPGFLARQNYASGFDQENYYGSAQQSSLPIRKDPLKGFGLRWRIERKISECQRNLVRVGRLALCAVSLILRARPGCRPSPDPNGSFRRIVLSNFRMCRKLCAGLLPNAPAAEVLAQTEVRGVFQERLDSFASASSGSSTRIDGRSCWTRRLRSKCRRLRTRVPSIKKRCLGNRAALVEDLYREPSRSRSHTHEGA